MSKRVRDEQEARAARTMARQLHSDGVTVEEIARRLETYGRVVRYWLDLDDSQWNYDTFMALRNRGQPLSEIASQAGVPREYIWHTIGTAPRRPDTVVRQIRVNRDTWERLPILCDELGVRKAVAGVRPSNSVARLLDGIAEGHLEVRWRDGASPDTTNLGMGRNRVA